MGTRAWGGRVALTQACAASISAEDTLPADLAMTGSEAGGPIGSAIGCVGVIGSAGLTGLAISGADEGAARADFSSCTAASSPRTRSLRYRQRS